MTPGDFLALNRTLTEKVLGALQSAQPRVVLAEAPPGAGKSTLIASVAGSLAETDGKLHVPVVTQTNDQADDLVGSLAKLYPTLGVARLVGSQGPSSAVAALVGEHPSRVSATHRIDAALRAQIIVATARKWQYVRAGLSQRRRPRFEVALIDEAYQMRSDALLGIASLFRKLFCVGDPGQLEPFTTVDDSVWKGLWYSPTRTAMGTLRAAHPDLQLIQLPTSWRLPPSAADLVSAAFYPMARFCAGTAASQRSLSFTARSRWRRGEAHLDRALDHARDAGWAYVELPERLTVRTDQEIARTLAALIRRLHEREPVAIDEREPQGKPLQLARIALVTAHNDQVQAACRALSDAGVKPDDLTVSTANKIQGREYDMVFVWHPLAGRRDATRFHLDAGRMCVMLSRHRHACIVVGRAGAARLLREFPDAEPLYLQEPEELRDGWEANHRVLEHLADHRIGP